MENLLGVGGQGVVIRKTVTIDNKSIKCAVRFVPVDYRRVDESSLTRNITKLPKESAILDTAQLYEEKQPCEMIASDLLHENIIEYLDHTFEVINGDLYHITGFYYLIFFDLFKFFLSIQYCS